MLHHNSGIATRIFLSSVHFYDRHPFAPQDACPLKLLKRNCAVCRFSIEDKLTLKLKNESKLI